MKIYTEFEQGSPEWHAIRLGKITSTRTNRILKANNLSVVDELIAEIECPYDAVWNAVDGYKSESMQWGHEKEIEAKQVYSEKTGIELIFPAFCVHDQFGWLAMSPDGLTPDFTGGVEVKCEHTKNHVKHIRMGGVPAENIIQVHQYFLVNEKLQWLDFISYDPRFAPKPMYIHRVERAEIVDELNKTMAELHKFWAKFEKYHKQVIF